MRIVFLRGTHESTGVSQHRNKRSALWISAVASGVPAWARASSHSSSGQAGCAGRLCKSPIHPTPAPRWIVFNLFIESIHHMIKFSKHFFWAAVRIGVSSGASEPAFFPCYRFSNEPIRLAAKPYSVAMLECKHSGKSAFPPFFECFCFWICGSMNIFHGFLLRTAVTQLEPNHVLFVIGTNFDSLYLSVLSSPSSAAMGCLMVPISGFL